MKIPNEKRLEKIRSEYPAGTRIRLVKMDDPQAPPTGSEGTVLAVDDIGSLIVKWDCGCGLNVVLGVDKVHKIKG